MIYRKANIANGSILYLHFFSYSHFIYGGYLFTDVQRNVFGIDEGQTDANTPEKTEWSHLI